MLKKCSCDKKKVIVWIILGISSIVSCLLVLATILASESEKDEKKETEDEKIKPANNTLNEIKQKKEIIIEKIINKRN